MQSVARGKQKEFLIKETNRMKLKKAFNQAIDFELTWYPERYASDQIKITKAAAKRNVRPCYDQYLDCDGDEISDCELHWYG
jgi:hypothetical protein